MVVTSLVVMVVVVVVMLLCVEMVVPLTVWVVSTHTLFVSISASWASAFEFAVPAVHAFMHTSFGMFRSVPFRLRSVGCCVSESAWNMLCH